MSAIEPFWRLFNISPGTLSKSEETILEAEMLRLLYAKIIDQIAAQNINYFLLIKENNYKDNAMLDENFMKFIINDIIATHEYTLEGIACYTQIPEDVIYEIATGTNTNPSLKLSQKILALHRTVRTNIYDQIVQKILTKHLK